jgi:VIT1/CCC1 family predicted Fe2+/Mn2+ transporter
VAESARRPGADNDPDRGQGQGIAQRLNWLRAGVLGANDGIVSVAAIVVGVAGATASNAPILTAGLAGLVGGAISMALGEYVSVSSQRDSERAAIATEKKELADSPEEELKELAAYYEDKGLASETAMQVAEELTKRDALAAHLAAEFNLDQSDIVSPWHAALASAVAFTIGAVLPLASMLLVPTAIRIVVTFIAVLVALAVTGSVAAHIGGSPKLRAAIRVTVGGALALAATYGIGTLLRVNGIG